MFRASLEKRLVALTEEARHLRQELDIIEEQLLQVTDEAEETRLRSLVSETPLAAQEHREAAKAFEVVRRDRDVKLKRLDKLERKQDAILDRMGEGR